MESYVGAIALGWLLAQRVAHFANLALQLPLDPTTLLPGFSLHDAVLELIRAVSLLPVWYILLRWLYFNPVKKEADEPTPDSEPGT